MGERTQAYTVYQYIHVAANLRALNRALGRALRIETEGPPPPPFLNGSISFSVFLHTGCDDVLGQPISWHFRGRTNIVCAAPWYWDVGAGTLVWRYGGGHPGMEIWGRAPWYGDMGTGTLVWRYGDGHPGMEIWGRAPWYGDMGMGTLVWRYGDRHPGMETWGRAPWYGDMGTGTLVWRYGNGHPGMEIWGRAS